MIAVTENNGEMVIEGTIEVGELINGLCCDGFSCEVLWMANFDKDDPNDTSVWYGCNSPSHHAARMFDAYAGINHQMLEDIAIFLLDDAPGE